MNESLMGGSTPVEPVVTNHAPVAAAADQSVTGPATVTLGWLCIHRSRWRCNHLQMDSDFWLQCNPDQQQQSESELLCWCCDQQPDSGVPPDRVTDAKGLSSTADVQVLNKAPKANQAPVVNQMQTVNLEAGQSYALNVQAADPDGDALTYAWSVPADMNATGTDTREREHHCTGSHL